MDSNHRFTDFKSVDSSAGLHAHLNCFLKNRHLLLFHLITSYLLVKQVFQKKLVGMEGLEPPRFSPVDFESTTSAIPSHTRKL